MNLSERETFGIQHRNSRHGIQIMKDNEEGEYFIEGSIKLEDDYKYDSNETGVSEVDHFYENIKKNWSENDDILVQLRRRFGRVFQKKFQTKLINYAAPLTRNPPPTSHRLK